MKPYFSKLLTEKERRGGTRHSKKTGGRVRIHPDPDHDYEEELSRVPVSRRRQYGYNSREFSDVLNPLHGYLKKSVGRPWDDVYSELCANLDRRSVSGAHVFQHMVDMVETNCFINEADGKVWSRNRYRGEGPITSTWLHGSFYVHPLTGILSFVAYQRYRYHKPIDPDRIDLTPGTYYGKIDGVWYHCTFMYQEVGEYVSVRVRMGMNPWRVTTKEVILSKRQLGKKEIRDQVWPALEARIQ